MIRAFYHLTRMELRLTWSETYAPFTAVMFYAWTPISFVLSVGPERVFFIGGGVLWVCVLLTALLSLEGLFQSDYEDGTLELYWIYALPLEVVFLSKAMKHWCTTAIPLLILTPFLAVLLPISNLGVLMAALILGTPSISMIGTFGASLTLGARYGGLLLIVILLPLLSPPLIFSVGALQAAAMGDAVSPHLLFLGAYGSLAIPLSLYFGSACLRQALVTA